MIFKLSFIVNRRNVCLISVMWCAGWTAGGGRAARAGENWTSASGRVWLTPHRNGFLQDERGVPWWKKKKIIKVLCLFNITKPFKLALNAAFVLTVTSLSLQMFFEDHIDDAKYCGHLYGLGSGSSYVQNGTGNAYEEEANKQLSWHNKNPSP